MEREPGFYWLRDKAGQCWTIGMCYDGDRWIVIRVDETFYEHELVREYTIGQRIPIPAHPEVEEE